ncbi:MAG: 30S ribosome-binding factor RbfA [Gammaproteobacteria bacterium]|nr:30S ribosome-binding factor RbfA [Gammaproteobacteria bacterium]
MAREFNRSDRVADQIQRELAALIQFEVKDPRIGMVTITGVEVSREFEYAKVYFTVLGDNAVREATVKGLTHAAGFLRRELAHRLKLRITPELQFVYDQSIDNAIRISELISTAVASDQATKGK